tara:strand:+ start:811 stop:2715 length:1905 start_codon:yes stop_codon:yes gene_type:complete
MKYLTKSRFKQGLECPIKLTSNYKSSEKNDDFLAALADGGFQVEELSRLHYKNGVLIEKYDNDISVSKTNNLLKKKNCIIYEAAFLNEQLFVRTDILVKAENTIKVIEVKAKSFDSTMENIFLTKAGKIKSEWKSYLFDLAFQKHVVKKSFPERKVESYLMLADKSKRASIDGLNQLFQITKNPNSRTGIDVKVESIDDVGDPIMESRNLSGLINDIISKDIHKIHGLSFKSLVKNFTELYTNQKEINWKDYKGHVCRECWMEQFNISDEDQLRPNIYELWAFRNQKKLFKSNIFFLDQLKKSDFDKSLDTQLSVENRQWLQIEKTVKQSLNKKVDFYLDVENLKVNMLDWKFPLHFIDFETCTSALPFTKGRHPYEQIAFQYSHHIIYHDGKIEHKSEYINAEPGRFPNYEFVRLLKKDLNDDYGSIFKYAPHENTILNAIYDQLIESNEPDKNELIDFIKSITNKKEKTKLVWKGDRDMIDLWDVVKKYFYHPYMKGSNSIKVVLPTIIKISEYIKKKYSKPIVEINSTSLNFSSNHVWIQDGNLDPYSSLPIPNFSQITNPVGDINKLNNGGAALTAYAKIQYLDMSLEEREIIKESLLKYCELDTLAMVMIYEFFASELKIHKFLENPKN